MESPTTSKLFRDFKAGVIKKDMFRVRVNEHVKLLRGLAAGAVGPKANAQPNGNGKNPALDCLKKIKPNDIASVIKKATDHINKNPHLGQAVIDKLEPKDKKKLGLNLKPNGKRSLTNIDIKQAEQIFIQYANNKKVFETIAKNIGLNEGEKKTFKITLNNIVKESAPKSKSLANYKSSNKSKQTQSLTQAMLKQQRIDSIKDNDVLTEYECKPLANLIKAPIVVLRKYSYTGRPTAYIPETIYNPDNLSKDKTPNPPIFVCNDDNFHFNAFIPDEIDKLAEAGEDALKKKLVKAAKRGGIKGLEKEASGMNNDCLLNSIRVFYEEIQKSKSQKYKGLKQPFGGKNNKAAREYLARKINAIPLEFFYTNGDLSTADVDIPGLGAGKFYGDTENDKPNGTGQARFKTFDDRILTIEGKWENGKPKGQMTVVDNFLNVSFSAVLNYAEQNHDSPVFDEINIVPGRFENDPKDNDTEEIKKAVSSVYRNQ
ncbi:MAG: hypothetical protein GY874_17400 [Desulfobacteraceae bacterium]|nr:hypothetical protein [Desulfobacteraceae bacterium]